MARELTDRQRIAAKLLASGARPRAVAAEIDISESTLARWLRREDMRKLKDAYLKEYLEGLAPRAYAELAANIESANPWVRLRASRDVLKMWGAVR